MNNALIPRMKVLLLKEIRGLGKKDDIKEVNDGYARNFLLPNKMAVVATPGVSGLARKEKEAREAEREKLAEKLRLDAHRMNDLTLTLFRRADEGGGIFGSVSALHIKEALLDKGFDHFEVKLEKPIKALGSFEVEVSFLGGIKGSVRILVENQK